MRVKGQQDPSRKGMTCQHDTFESHLLDLWNTKICYCLVNLMPPCQLIRSQAEIKTFSKTKELMGKTLKGRLDERLQGTYKTRMFL